MQELYKQLKEFGTVKINANLANLSTFKVGGPADLLVEVENSQNLASLLSFLTGEGVEYLVIGGGSNLVFPDDGWRGVVVKCNDRTLKIVGDKLEVGSGAPLALVVAMATKDSLAGMEWASGLPGSVGGAVRGNAGAMGGNIAGCLEKVEVWQDGDIKTLANIDCEFAYRDSIFKHAPIIILRAYFKLTKGDQKKILALTQANIKSRAGKHPTFPSAGSFFKNVSIAKWPGKKSDLPPEFLEYGFVPTGWLVEQVGLKGVQIGGAMVSKEHGNFIVNYKNDTAVDILALVEKIKESVYNKFNVELEEEVQVIHS